ncbi:MAG: S41 family peptidase [Herpetosiphon sp.]
MRKLASWRPPIWLVALIMCLSLSLGTGIGYVRGQENRTGNCTLSKDICSKFSDFWDVWNLAEQRFVDPKAINHDRMVAGAINGMLDSLGDEGHTRYETAEQFKTERETLQGKFEGIGAYIESQAGQPRIVSPIEGSPAEAAGIKAGDVILKINGKTTQGMTTSEIAATIRGKPGTNVTITIRHQGEEAPLDLTITRAAITVPATSYIMLPNQIAFIRLAQFSEQSGVAVSQRINDARTAGARAIIFDVRDNPGGLRDQAVAVTGLFVPTGSVVLREEYRGGKENLYRSEAAKPQTDLPMVVLVNNGSASSAEIFAAALQDYGRATVIGVPSYGTGTVLGEDRLPDGSAVWLGIAQWRSPKGRYLRHEGVTPDLLVALPYGVRPTVPRDIRNASPDEIYKTKDLQLSRALSILGGRSTIEGPSRFTAR